MTCNLAGLSLKGRDCKCRFRDTSFGFLADVVRDYRGVAETSGSGSSSSNAEQRVLPVAETAGVLKSIRFEFKCGVCFGGNECHLQHYIVAAVASCAG